MVSSVRVTKAHTNRQESNRRAGAEKPIASHLSRAASRGTKATCGLYFWSPSLSGDRFCAGGWPEPQAFAAVRTVLAVAIIDARKETPEPLHHLSHGQQSGC